MVEAVYQVSFHRMLSQPVRRSVPVVLWLTVSVSVQMLSQPATVVRVSAAVASAV